MTAETIPQARPSSLKSFLLIIPVILALALFGVLFALLLRPTPAGSSITTAAN